MSISYSSGQDQLNYAVVKRPKSQWVKKQRFAHLLTQLQVQLGLGKGQGVSALGHFYPGTQADRATDFHLVAVTWWSAHWCLKPSFGNHSLFTGLNKLPGPWSLQKRHAGARKELDLGYLVAVFRTPSLDYLLSLSSPRTNDGLSFCLTRRHYSGSGVSASHLVFSLSQGFPIFSLSRKIFLKCKSDLVTPLQETFKWVFFFPSG